MNSFSRMVGCLGLSLMAVQGWTMGGAIQGAPAGAALEVVVRALDGQEARAACDAQGRFTLAPPEGETLKLEVLVDGEVEYVMAPVPSELLDDEQLVLALSSAAATRLGVTASDESSSEPTQDAEPAPWKLGGVIYGGGQPMAGAVVTLHNGTRTQVLQTTTTAENGRYGFMVESGVYDLEIQPPADSAYQLSWLNDVSVTGANVNQNIVLISEAVTLSGVIRGAGGVPAHGATVILRDRFSSDLERQELAQGRFHFAVQPGVYSLAFQYYGMGVRVIPQGNIHQFVSELLVQTDTDLDLQLPVSVLRGKVVDTSEKPVSNVQAFLSLADSWYDNERYFETIGPYEGSVETNANGEFEVALYNHNYSRPLILRPLNNPELAFSIDYALSITTDTSRTFVLTQGNLLQGIVHDPSGLPRQNVQLDAVTPNSGFPWEVLATARSNADGSYSFRLPTGTYAMRISGTKYPDEEISVSGPAPNYFIARINEAFSVTTDTLKNIMLPFVEVSGRITQEDGIGIGHATITAPLSQIWTIETDWAGSITGLFNYSGNPVRADADGYYSFVALPHPDLVFNCYPPAGSNLGMKPVHVTPLTTNTTVNVMLPRMYRLSGQVRSGQNPLTDFLVIMFTPDHQAILNQTATDADGHYELSIGSGQEFIIDGHLLNRNDLISPDYYYINTIQETMTLTTDTILNIDAPLNLLEGRTTDRNGVSVSGVRLSFPYLFWSVGSSGRGFYHLDETFPVSDANGYYSIYLADTILRAIIHPPVNSGFALTTIDALDMTQPLQQQIILNFVDSVPPRILAGPYASALGQDSALIEWQTDEPATSQVRYRAAASEGDPEGEWLTAELPGLRTVHSVLLTTLTAATRYEVLAASADEGGNGPTLSDPVTFETFPMPDTAPPIIIEGPVIEGITDRAALVEWVTDEPASGVIAWGTSPDALETTVTLEGFALRHSAHLTGLTSGTQYYIRAASTDVAGNGPTLSAVLAFQTAAGSDLAPPVITAGPIVVEVTQTGATIEWTTDEPATSGVSYNDGTHYGVTHEDALVTQHQAHLAGLSAATAYTFTVSSTDGAGNGPTLSEPQSFTTPAAGDTQPPCITFGPLPLLVVQHTALITWWTDEPSDAVVFYGKTEALGSTITQAVIRRRHFVHIGNLEPGTRYYYKVQSTDARGNGPVTSQLDSFQTFKAPAPGPRIIKGPEIAYTAHDRAVVTWTTDLPCDGFVEYGRNGAYDHRVSDARRTQEHAITLTRLESQELYDYRVGSSEFATDVDDAPAGEPALAGAASEPGGASEPGALSFTTAAGPDQAAPDILELIVVYIEPRSAVVTWRTAELADSALRFGIAGQTLDRVVGDLTPALEHRLTLTNLEPGRLYQAQAQSTDPSGNRSAWSEPMALTTPTAPDQTPPTASAGPAVELRTREGGVIQCASAEPAAAQLFFGSDPQDLDRQAALESAGLSHRFDLGGLASDTRYYFRVVLRDTVGNTWQSAVGSLVTRWQEPDTPALATSPGQLRFIESAGRGVDVEHGDVSTTLGLTLRNPGTAHLTITEARMVGADQAHFGLEGALTVPWVLDPGATMPLIVRFAPQVTTRTLGLDARLELLSDAPGQAITSIALEGDAVPVELSVFTVD